MASEHDATQRAIAEYTNENYEEALSLLLAIRGKEASDPTALYYIGLCHKQTGNYEAAATSLAAALKSRSAVKDASLELIAVLINLERYEDAMEWVLWAEKNKVRPTETAYQKGMILSKLKRYQEARQALENARNGVPENDQQVDLQIAVALAEEGKIQEARASLKAIVTRYPGSEVASFVQEYEQSLAAAALRKKWSIVANLNYQYDDNMFLKSKVPGASTETRNENSGGLNESLRIEYDQPISETWSNNFQYAVQNASNFRTSSYNMINHSVTYSNIWQTDQLIIALPLNLSQTLLDKKGYSYQYAFKPAITIPFTSEHIGQVSLGASRREMLQEATSTEQNRNAVIYSGQLSYITLFAGDRGMLNLHLDGAYEHTEGYEWRNTTAKAGIDLLLPVTESTRLILTTEGSIQEYFENSSGRKDSIITASAAINQKLSSYLYLNVQYAYTRALSNVDLYDYQRNVITSGIELRF